MIAHRIPLFICTVYLLTCQTRVGEPSLPQLRSDALIIHREETVSHITLLNQSLQVLGRVDGDILVLGDDAVIEGRVEGDAIVIGGSLLHRRGGFINGDVIVIGGKYSRDRDALPRHAGSRTLLIPAYGGSIRETLQHPWQSLLLPEFTPLYFGLHLLGFLLYFLTSLVLIALIPSQLNRATRVLHTNSLKVSLLGLLTLSLFVIVMLLVARHLPIEAAVLLSLFGILAYVGVAMFGSLAVHLLVGRWIQHRIHGRGEHSNVNALLYGMVLSSILLSVPIVGVLTRLILLILSFGIVSTLPYPATRYAADLK